MGASECSLPPVPSLPPPLPKSPPVYPDVYGKNRELAKVQMLKREIGLLETVGGGREVMGASECSLPPVPSLPPPLPKSPPVYPDVYGKNRELAKVQMLKREIGLLEEELKSIDNLQPASRCCKEITEFVVGKPDPLIAINRKRRKGYRFWRWICGLPCFHLSWIWCCGGCSHHLELPHCGDCNLELLHCCCSSSCSVCNICNCKFRNFLNICLLPKKSRCCSCQTPSCCCSSCFKLTCIQRGCLFECLLCPSFDCCPPCDCCSCMCSRPKCREVNSCCSTCTKSCCNPCCLC